MKKYSVFNKQATWLVLGGWGVLLLLVAVVDIYFITVYATKSETYTGLLLSLFVSVPTIMLTVYLYKVGLFSKYLLRYQFDQNGIRCSGLIWGEFFVTWDSIRTFGFVVSSEKYSFCPIIIFSQKPNESWVSGTHALRRDRLIVEYEKDKWEAIERCLPDDMKVKLSRSIDEFKVGYYRR